MKKQRCDLNEDCHGLLEDVSLQAALVWLPDDNMETVGMFFNTGTAGGIASAFFWCIIWVCGSAKEEFRILRDDDLVCKTSG